MKQRWSITIVAMLAVPVVAVAHHGFEMFESDKTVVLRGTIKDWQWTNPHAWIQLNVERDGVVTEWSLEGVSITQLGRQGWKRDLLKVGDVVSVSIHPLKNGKPGGQWLQVMNADGKLVGPPRPATR
jgi:Family of unknown function (DUF6152)